MAFDLVPAFVMGVLAAWLGLSLLVRAPRDPAAQAFALLCLNLTIYGLTIVIGRMSIEPEVRGVMHRIEIAETVILPPIWLLFINIVADTRRFAALRRAALLIFGALGVMLALFALFSPQINVDATTPRFPTPWLVALSLLQRILPLLLSGWLVLRSYTLTGDDPAERGRRRFFARAVLIAITGAFLASAAREVGFAQSPGHLLMDVGLALMAYMVLAYRLLLPARVARRAFIRSLLGGLLTALLILVIIVVEPLVGQLLGVNTPLLTIFALIALMAIFGPARDLVGAWLDRRFFHREFDYGQLLRAVSDDLFERGDLTGQLDAGLSAICRTLKVRSGAVAVSGGGGLRVLSSYGIETLAADAFHSVATPDAPEAHYGDWPAWPQARLLLPLRRGEQTLGLVALGPKRSDEPYGEVERVLLDSLGRYLALAIAHARTQQVEELAMAALAEQSRQLQLEQATLEAHAEEARRLLAAPPVVVAPPATGLRVAALGPLRVEREGAVIERWGGDKAGNYQAEALFAFLFDRRGKGLTKDEAEEIIWPDLGLEKADTAFHRTLSALRRTLEPGLRRGNESKLIAYHHERYWLAPEAIDWCDRDDYARAAERGHTALRQGDLLTARASFEQTAALYRGDYMDDCPFFGDSADVEEQREQLRQQHVNALLGLGAAYEQLGMVGEAATAYRNALATSQNDCPRAEEALDRLEVA